MPLTEQVKFQSRLQRGNRVQVPNMVRWRFKLKSYQILEVTVGLLGVWGASQNFLTRMSKDGRIVIPKQALDLLRNGKFNIEGHMMEVTLSPS